MDVTIIGKCKTQIFSLTINAVLSDGEWGSLGMDKWGEFVQALGKNVQSGLNKVVMKYLPLTRKLLVKTLIKNVETGEQLNR